MDSNGTLMDGYGTLPMSFNVVPLWPRLCDREKFSRRVTGNGRLMNFEPRSTTAFQIEYDLEPAGLQRRNYYERFFAIARATLVDEENRPWMVLRYDVDDDVLRLHVDRFAEVPAAEIFDYVERLDQAFRNVPPYDRADPPIAPLGC